MKSVWSLVFLLGIVVLSYGCDRAPTEPTPGRDQATSDVPPPRVVREVRIPVQQGGVVAPGTLQTGSDGVRWVLPSGAVITLPFRLPTLVAGDGKSFLQYGDSAEIFHPSKVDLFFVDEQGQEQARVLDRYGAETEVAIGDDGYVTVAGASLADLGRTEIAVYMPNGERVFDRLLPEGRRANFAVATPGGHRIAVGTTDTENRLAEHRLVVFDDGGNQLAEHRDLRIVQRVVAVGDVYFVQGKNQIALVNANDGEMAWIMDESVHLVSPFGAAIHPSTNTLFLIAAVWNGIPEAVYRWQVQVRDVETGDLISRLDVPGEYPGSYERVVLGVDESRIELFVGEDDSIALEWQR